VPAVFVWLGEYGDSLYAKLFTRSNNPNGNLTAIGDQNFVKHLFFPNQEPRLFQALIKRLFPSHRQIAPKKISFKTPEAKVADDSQNTHTQRRQGAEEAAQPQRMHKYLYILKLEMF
jgi:hypothetical protein